MENELTHSEQPARTSAGGAFHTIRQTMLLKIIFPQLFCSLGAGEGEMLTSC